MTAERELSDEQCLKIAADASSIILTEKIGPAIPRAFAHPLRAAYAAGRESMRKDAVEACQRERDRILSAQTEIEYADVNARLRAIAWAGAGGCVDAIKALP